MSVVQCEDIANAFSNNLADLLEVPVFQYNCSEIEDQGYEGLTTAIETHDPIYGPKEFLPMWGTTLVGTAKNFIMFNVNVIGTREQGMKICKHLNTHSDLRVQTLMLEDGGNCVVNCEILDSSVCNLSEIYEQIQKYAADQSIAVAGSHVVGSLPLNSLLDAADFYIKKENLFIVKEQQKIRFVINKLGLNSVSEFKPDSKIIEYVLGVDRNGPLQSLTLQQFIESVGARTIAPRGGSVAAVVASLGMSLGQMTSWMTYGSKKYEGAEPIIRQVLPELHKNINQANPLIDADAMAFRNYQMAQKMPANSAEEKNRKHEALNEALVTIVHVPLRVMEIGTNSWEHIEKIASAFNNNLKSDLQIGIKCLATGIWSAFKSVEANLEDISDDTTRQDISDRATKMLETCETTSKRLLSQLE